MITLPERLDRLISVFEKELTQLKGDIRVSLPAVVTSFDPQKQTISCIPCIRELICIAGKVDYVTLPELQEVPIEIPRAGNFAITLPIKVGQECRVTFQDLCIDGWWARGGIQNWNDLRRHDFSDAIASFSPYSQPNILPNYSTENLEIRNLDRSIFISVQNDKTIISTNGNLIEVNNGEISLQVGSNSLKINSSGIEMEATAINLNGTLTINGTPYLAHTHSGVMSGNSNTGPVVG